MKSPSCNCLFIAFIANDIGLVSRPIRPESHLSSYRTPYTDGAYSIASATMFQQLRLLTASEMHSKTFTQSMRCDNASIDDASEFGDEIKQQFSPQLLLMTFINFIDKYGVMNSQFS